MSHDPQLIIFEPLKEPRTVTLNVIEDISAATPVIFDEYGHEVTDYKVLHDESLSTVDPVKNEIRAYIENWESQGNVIDEKRARKIAKRKRVQATKKLKKQRSRKRKAAMKSLIIHGDCDTSPLANTDVEEERAILRAVKSQNYSIKNVLNIKPNRIINCNTNVRPFENSTIEFGRRKSPVDVVVLDSDEQSDPDSDDIQININSPQSISTRWRNTANAFVDDKFCNRNSSVTIAPTRKKRRNNKIEVVLLDDSSESDVECISCEEFVQSLSDDDNDVNNSASSSEKKRSNNINFEDASLPNSEELRCVSVDAEVSDEVINMVDSFCNKYIQPYVVPHTEIPFQTDSEFAISQILITKPISLAPVESQKSLATSFQIVITEPVSLRTNPPSVSVESQKSLATSSQMVITEPLSLQTNFSSASIKSKKNSGPIPEILIPETGFLQPNHPSTQSKSETKKVSFMNGDELNIAGNDSFQIDSHESDSDEKSKSENLSDDYWNNSERFIEHNDKSSTNILEFDSIPSPDYTPSEDFLNTASNKRAFINFMRSRQVLDSSDDGESEYDSPVEMEESASASTTKYTLKSNTTCQPRKQWQKCGSDESVDQHLRTNSIRDIRPGQQSFDHKNQQIEVLEYAVQDSRPNNPRQKFYYDGTNEMQGVESRAIVREQSSYFREQSSVSVITRPEQTSKANFGRKHSFPYKKFQKRPFQKTTPSPSFTDTDGNQSQRSNRISASDRLSDTNLTPARQSFRPNNRRPVLDRLDDFQSESNSSVKFSNKRVDRIAESRNKSEKCIRDEDDFEQNCFVEPVAYFHQFENNSGRGTCDSGFCQQNDEKRGSFASLYERNPPWQFKSTTKTGGDDEDTFTDIDNEIRDKGETNLTLEYYEGFSNSFISPPCSDQYIKPHVEPKYTTNRDRYHSEPYEEDKFTPGSARRVGDYKTPRGNQNRGRFQNWNQFRRISPYSNRRTDQGNDFRYRLSPKQRQRLNRKLPNRRFFDSSPNTSRYGQQSEGIFQNSRVNQQSSYTCNKQRGTQPQTGSFPSFTICSAQTQFNREVLFTRRNKSDYRANVSDLHDNKNQLQQSSQRNSRYDNKDTSFYHQDDFRSYESDVAEKLRPVSNYENSFSWENSRACDFVPFNANERVATSPPPWSINDSSTAYNSRINAISRRLWISDVINSKT